MSTIIIVYISVLILSIIVETDSSAATADSTTAQGKKMKLKKSLKKAGAKNSDDVDFEDLFGPDPEEVGTTGKKLYKCKVDVQIYHVIDSFQPLCFEQLSLLRIRVKFCLYTCQYSLLSVWCLHFCISRTQPLSSCVFMHNINISMFIYCINF